MTTTPLSQTHGEVLLLADDPGLLQSVRTALAPVHCAVRPAASPDEAQALLEKVPVELLVVDADRERPGLRSLLACFKAQHPGLRNVVGLHDPRQPAARAQLAGVNVWLEKPVGPTRLSTAVHTLLAELRSETLRQDLLHRQNAPFVTSVPLRHFGLNE